MVEKEEAYLWTKEAACLGADINIFFPERGESTKEAKAICLGCPVQDECLEYSLGFPDTLQGIWAGKSARSRRRLRKR